MSPETVLIALAAVCIGASLLPLYRYAKRIWEREQYKRFARKRPYKRTNGLLRYQMSKETPEAIAAFRKLPARHQVQAAEARKRLLEQHNG